MLESFWFSVFVGTILGALAGLGVGGGSLLMLWLTVVIGMEHGQARGINLLFFLPAAVVSTLLRWKQGQLCIQKLLPGIIGGCAAALIGSYLGFRMELELLRKIFGGLLLVTGLRELFYRPRFRKAR